MLAQVGDLATATHEQLEQAFTSLYRVQGSSLRKALSFFTHMAQEGDIALSAFIHTAHHQGPRRTHQPTHAAATSTQLARFHNGGYALLICMGGPFTLEVPERQFLFGLVDRFQEYEQGRGTTIHEKKHGQAQEMTREKLYGRRMFLSPRYHGFFGVTEDGRRFLVEREAWEQSVREGEEVARWTREQAAEINLDPANWESCIGVNPGVRLIEREPRTWGIAFPHHSGSTRNPSSGDGCGAFEYGIT